MPRKPHATRYWPTKAIPRLDKSTVGSDGGASRAVRSTRMLLNVDGFQANKFSLVEVGPLTTFYDWLLPSCGPLRESPLSTTHEYGFFHRDSNCRHTELNRKLDGRT